MKPSTWLVIGALAASVGVAVGAFGAHGLPEFLASRVPTDLLPKRIEQFETGVRYHLVQAIGLAILGLAARRGPSKWFSLAGWMFLASIALFSGLLYLLVVLNMPTLGMIVPLGGLAAIAAWACLALGARGE
jgi:uncharacterized membrane protein YgdD (TMEM256/DUF423 family)